MQFFAHVEFLARLEYITATLLRVAIFAKLDSPLHLTTSSLCCFENQFEGLFMSRRSAKSLALINQVKGTCPSVHSKSSVHLQDIFAQKMAN